MSQRRRYAASKAKRLIPDDQLHVPEQTTQRPLPRHAAAARVVDAQWDLKLRMSGSTVGEQCGGDPRGCHAENGLTLQMSVDGAAYEGLPGPPGPLQEKVVGRRIVRDGRSGRTRDTGRH